MICQQYLAFNIIHKLYEQYYIRRYIKTIKTLLRKIMNIPLGFIPIPLVTMKQTFPRKYAGSRYFSDVSVDFKLVERKNKQTIQVTKLVI